MNFVPRSTGWQKPRRNREPQPPIAAVNTVAEMTDASADRECMARALRLARRGRYTTAPNPRVGCVLVRDGVVIGEGWHRVAGGPHAEVDALARAGGSAAGATAYVTLEPCSHRGRTGPCADALVAAGVARVVVAMEDPNPQVAGDGLKRLSAAGIDVSCGLLQAEAKALNRGFISRMLTGIPFVMAKLGSSLDGRTAMANGESQWITGPPARRQVQRLRAASCAILSGVGTVLHDDPSLTVRQEELGEPYPGEAIRQPLRVIVDSALRTPVAARVLKTPGSALVAGLRSEGARFTGLQDHGAEVLCLPEREGRVDLAALLRWLAAERACNEVMVEAGPTLVGALLREGLLDELHIFMAPTLLGSNARPLVQLPLDHMGQQQRLSIEELRQVGEDWWIRATPPKHEDGAGH